LLLGIILMMTISLNGTRGLIKLIKLSQFSTYVRLPSKL